MVRCAEYRARPHHADQLHVDFWWRGINICCDAGTYLYNGDPPWTNGLVTTAVHNTVTVDDQDQMTPYSRFLWLDWSHGRVTYDEPDYWEGYHDGYTRLAAPVIHRRGIQRLNDTWIIADELTSDSPHDYALHWLIPKMPYNVVGSSITLQTCQGEFFIRTSVDNIDLKVGDSKSVRGWRSSSYGQKEPALSFRLVAPKEKTALFWTILSPRQITVNELGLNTLQIDDVNISFGENRLIEVQRS